MTVNGEKAVAEVARLHAAIEGWVTGRIPQENFEKEIARYLAPGFRIVEPDGRIGERGDLMKGLYNYRGKNPDFHIKIEDCKVVEERDDLVIVTYLERQTGATLAKPTNARRATCIFKVDEQVTHLFLHETWVEA